MLEYAPMLHVSYFAQNYAGIIHQGLGKIFELLGRAKKNSALGFPCLSCLLECICSNTNLDQQTLRTEGETPQ